MAQGNGRQPSSSDGELVQDVIPEVEAMLPKLDISAQVRIADTQLAHVARHLTKIKHIEAVKPVLALVRQAQTLLDTIIT